MKTRLYTADSKRYSYAYMSAFSVARALLCKEIQQDVEYVRDCMKGGYHPSLNLIVTIAYEITTYNELSSIRPFYKTEDF